MNKKLGFKNPPRLFLKNDEKNSKEVFGKTAFYDPGQSSVTIFIAGRHPKDILRSLAHELVHHHQNERGDFSSDKCGDDISDTYAQDNKHLRNMEKEAYLVGNMCFRDWEDSCKFNLSESKFLKENKKMSATLNKKTLTKMIKSILSEQAPPIRIAAMPGDTPKAPRNEQEAIQLLKDAQRDIMIPIPKSDPRHGSVAGEDITKVRATREQLLSYGPSGQRMILRSKLKVKAALKWIEERNRSNPQDPIIVAIPAGFASVIQLDQDPEIKALASTYKIKGATDSQIAPDDTPRKPVTPPSLEEGEGGDCGCTDLDGTPEREENLYTERFEQRDTSLYNRLLKEWTK